MESGSVNASFSLLPRPGPALAVVAGLVSVNTGVNVAVRPASCARYTAGPAAVLGADAAIRSCPCTTEIESVPPRCGNEPGR